MTTLSLVSGYIICIFVGLLGLVVLWKIITGSIDLTDLISEENGGASMSRFQFLIFTFVIAISLFLVIVGHPGGPQLPVVPPTIMALLGISGSSYLVSKAIQFSDPAGIVDRGSDIVISPVQATVKAGATQQFTANIPQKPGSGVKWEVIAGPGTITSQGLYTAVAAAAAAAGGGGGAAAPALAGQHATIKVTSDEFPNAYDLAVVTIS